MHILNNMAIERAWKDTKASWNWKQGLTALFVFTIGTIIHLKWAPSSSETTEEIMLWLTFSVAPVIALAVASFFYNLFCAPYRIEQDDLIAARKHITILQEKLSEVRPNESLSTFYAHRNQFTLKEAAHLLADSPITKGETTGPAAGYLSDLETAAYEGNLKPLRPIKPMDMTTYKMRNNGVLDWKVPPQEGLEVSKGELERYVEEIGLPSLNRFLLPIPSKLI